MANKRNTRTRFWENVSVRAPNECWEWTAARSTTGYGNYREHYVQYGAHRYAYIDAVGEIPPGMVVRHTCDNRGCVNPRHLELGTYADNNRDTVKRGRSLTGERNHAAKLTEAKVKEARERAAQGEPVSLIAEDLGVSHPAAYNAITGRSWTRVPTPPVTGGPRRRRDTYKMQGD